MPFNDLKMLQRSVHLRTALYGGVDHVHRQARFLSSDGASSAPYVSSMRRSVQRRLQGQGVYLSRPLPLHGLRAVDLPRKSQGYRSLPACPEEQAVPHGDTQCRFPQYAGQCEQGPRLAYLCRPCTVADTGCPEALPRRRLCVGTRQHSLRLGCNDHRSVPLHVPMGQFQADQGGGKTTYPAGFARQYPGLHLHFRRQAP